MVTLLIGLLLFFPILSEASFNDKNIEMISSMIRYLRVEQYILVSKSLKMEYLVPKLRMLSKNNISGMYLTFFGLMNYFEMNKAPERKAMIVINVEDNAELETMMEVLRLKVS